MSGAIASTSYRALSASITGGRSRAPHSARSASWWMASTSASSSTYSSYATRPYAALASHSPDKVVSNEVPIVLPSQDKGKGKAVDANSGKVVEASKPASASAATTTATPTQPPPRIPRRTLGLKGKKAPISLTPTAVSRLKSLLADPTNPQLIRVSVKNRGCAGMAYHLEYVAPPGGKFDEVVEQDGIKVLIDSKALFSIIGSEMDWKEDRLSAKFVFNNPNVKDSCGCGESFTI